MSPALRPLCFNDQCITTTQYFYLTKVESTDKRVFGTSAGNNE